MPNVRPGHQVSRGGYHTKGEIIKTQRPAFPRDDIKQAYAGEENEGPFSDSKTDHSHSTNVKSRVTEKSKTRTPMR